MINYNLKPNSSKSMVNQFLHTYNYEEALSIVEELFHLQINLNALWSTLPLELSKEDFRVSVDYVIR